MKNPEKKLHSRRADRKPHFNSSSRGEPGIDAVIQVEKHNHEGRSRMDQLSSMITNKAGSAVVILIHAIWFVLWLVINLDAIPGIPAFDPFPFSFLTMIVSLEAIFLTLFVLVSQNRMTHEADKRARLDLEINIIAERETTLILRMLNEISHHLKVEGPTRREFEELSKETRVEELADKLEEALPPSQKDT